MEKPHQSDLLIILVVIFVLILVFLAFIAGILVTLRLPPATPAIPVAVLTPGYTYTATIATASIPPTSTRVSSGSATHTQVVTLRTTSTSTRAPTGTATLTPVATPGPGTILPKAKTATPLPAKVVTITLTNQLATSLISQQVRSGFAQLRNPSVVFTKENIQFSGDVTLLPPIPGLPSVSGTIRGTGKPQCEDDNIQFVVLTVTAEPVDFAQNKDIKDAVERAVNDVLNSRINSQRVKSCTLSDGMLTIVAIEPQ